MLSTTCNTSCEPLHEEWRPVVGMEGKYEVSDHGRVWSWPRRRPLTLVETPLGYLVVCLSRPPGSTTRKVHRLVLEAFVGPAPEGAETRHLDGDKHNNWLSNLAWGTSLENAADTCAHGTLPAHNQTACRRGGHALTGANLRSDGNGTRRCRACKAARNVLRARGREDGPELDLAELADRFYAHYVAGGPDPYVELRSQQLSNRGGLWTVRQFESGQCFRAADVRASARKHGLPLSDNHARAALARAVQRGDVKQLARGLYQRLSPASGGV